MATAEITTEITINAPLERVWSVLRDPRSMRYWQGVTDVRPRPGGAEIVGEIKLPVGNPVRLTSKLAITDDALSGDTATATLTIDNPKTSLHWTLRRESEDFTLCALRVVYITPSGMLGLVLKGSILRKVIIDNIRGYIKRVRDELNPATPLSPSPLPA